MSKQINLEEILKKELIPIVFSHSPEMTFNATLRAMKEACKQTLKLAYENSCVEIKEIGEELIISDSYEYDGLKISVNELSILDTIRSVV